MARRQPPAQTDEAPEHVAEPPVHIGALPPHVEVLAGKVALDEIAKVNEDLAAILRRLRRAARDEVFVANYPYGSLPVHRGVFCPPCPGEPICRECQRLSNWIESNWSDRASLPLQLLLSGWAEAYIDRWPETIPLRLLQKGEFFGAFELSNAFAGIAAEPPLWNVSSGARSVVIAVNLADRRVRRALTLTEGLELPETALPDLINPEARPWDWEFTRLIASKKSNWHSRIFFVPADWIFADDDASRRLGIYVRDTAWRQIQLLSLHMADDTVDLDEERLLLPYHTARHLLLIARGDAPAFRLVRKDEPDAAQAAPFKEVRAVLEQALPEGISPLFLQPYHLRTPGAAGYYSLSRPTLLGPRLPPPRRNQAGALEIMWNGLQSIHGQRRSRLDLEKTTAHAPWETSRAPGRHRSREGLGLHAYLCQDLGLPVPPQDGKDDPKDSVSKFPLRNSRGAGSFFTACIRVVRL